MKCPHCGQSQQQHKNGKTKSGSQRYRCYACQHSYTPQKKAQGYGAAIRRRVIQQYVDGGNLRRIGRQLGLSHPTVANWVKAYAEQLPEAPVPQEVKSAELDELFTFIGEEKTGFTW
jgi:transposase-like protein